MKYLKAYGIFFVLFALIGYVVNNKAIKGPTADLGMGIVAGKVAEGAGLEVFVKKLVAILIGYEIGKWAAESQETSPSPRPGNSVVNLFKSPPPSLSDEEMKRLGQHQKPQLLSDEQIKRLLQRPENPTPVQPKP